MTELFTTERIGIGVSAVLLCATGACSTVPETPQATSSLSPEITAAAPDEDVVATVGGVVVAIYDKYHPSEQYPAYSTPKGNDWTGSYARGERVDVICSAAGRYLLHNPDEWLDKKAVKVTDKAKVPQCTADQIPEEYTVDPETPEPAAITRHPKPTPTQTNPCKVSYALNPATRKFESFYHCY